MINPTLVNLCANFFPRLWFSNMASRSFLVDDVYHVPEKPYQPQHLSFPARQFGKASPVHRSFQLVWFNRFKWLHYDVPRDAVFCHICCKAIKEKVVKLSGLTEASFVRNGYTNWKDATRNFTNHEKTECHRQAVVALQPTRDVSEMLSSKIASDKEYNRKYFLRILSSIKFLAHQGLPLRGDGDESMSNFYQLMQL